MCYISVFPFPRYHNLQDNKSFSPKVLHVSITNPFSLSERLNSEWSFSSSSHGSQLGLVEICGGMPLATRKVNCSAVSQTVLKHG